MLHTLWNGGKLILGKHHFELWHRGGRIDKVNCNTVWTLNNRGFLKKETYHTISLEGVGAHAWNMGNVKPVDGRRIPLPVTTPTQPKSFKRMLCRS